LVNFFLTPCPFAPHETVTVFLVLVFNYLGLPPLCSQVSSVARASLLFPPDFGKWPFELERGFFWTPVPVERQCTLSPLWADHQIHFPLSSFVEYDPTSSSFFIGEVSPG